MKVQFLGAARTVTGSCYFVDTGKCKFLVDCGAFQGPDDIEKMNREEFPFNPADIDYVFVTHGHFDHVGRLPILVKNGFKGKVFSTGPTKDLARIVLLDSARLQDEEYMRWNTKKEKYGNFSSEGNSYEMQEPLFTEEDVLGILNLFETYPYGDSITLENGIEFRMRDAGHILGSMTLELWISNENDRVRKLVFSGDIGQPGQRIIRDPDYIREADYVFMEATYGNRIHKSKDETLLELLAIINQAKQTHGNVLIPTFAIERTQELIYELNLFYENRIIENFPVFLDSPMAIETLEVFKKYPQFYDEDAKRLIEKGDDPFSFPDLKLVESADDSRRLVTQKGCLIMAGSGMCTGGRIVAHLANNIEDPNIHVVFVGYQVKGTLGRRIVDGEPVIKIKGRTYEPKAQIHTLGGFSAHADERDLRYWLRSFGKTPRRVFICHAEEDIAIAFAEKVALELGVQTDIPHHAEVVEIE